MRNLEESHSTPVLTASSSNSTETIIKGIQGPYSKALYTNEEAINAVWILASAGFIFIMQAGFALIESGAVTKKNRTAMLVKNIYNVALCGILYWLFGYGLAFANPKYFVGSDPNVYTSYGFE
jgi:hypothetical protein